MSANDAAPAPTGAPSAFSKTLVRPVLAPISDVSNVAHRFRYVHVHDGFAHAADGARMHWEASDLPTGVYYPSPPEPVKVIVDASLTLGRLAALRSPGKFAGAMNEEHVAALKRLARLSKNRRGVICVPIAGEAGVVTSSLNVELGELGDAAHGWRSLDTTIRKPVYVNARHLFDAVNHTGARVVRFGSAYDPVSLVNAETDAGAVLAPFRR